ncbi:MAG: pilus assembly protein [Acidobacteria bacterium]|nr:pilus assembly protein [Acidobacteriota bacterium]
MRFNRKRRKGNTLVESAFILTTFIAVTVGVLDIGQVMYAHQGLVERARAAASWAGSRPFNATNIRNVTVYNTSSPTNSSKAIYNGLTLAMVSATLEDSGTPEARVVVKISNYPFTFYSPWITAMYTARTITAVATHEASLP